MDLWQNATILERSAPGHIVIESSNRRYLLEHGEGMDESLRPGQSLDVVVDGQMVVKWRPSQGDR